MDLKQLPGLTKTKMVMYIIASKLNSTFGMIGSATVEEITQFLVFRLIFTRVIPFYFSSFSQMLAIIVQE